MSSGNLVGREISFFLDGGWQISGVVEEQHEDKIIINKDDSLFLIFKNKVSFIQLKGKSPSKEDGIKVQKKPNVNRVESSEEDLEDSEEFFPENGISYSETFMNIPGSLLGKKPNSDDDFSVSFKESNTNNVISFRVENDS